MKTILKTTDFLFIALILITACSNDDGPGTDTENLPPGAFDLISAPNGANNVDVLPEFSWNAAIDPDGDPVTYTLYLDPEENIDPITEVASNLTSTSFVLQERLLLREDYSWKVVASDGKGGKISSHIYNFSTRSLSDAVQVTANAGFSKRSGAKALAFKDKLWVIGGYDQSFSNQNDVWNSQDGETWTAATLNAAFPKRSHHCMLVFDGKMWVVGGQDGNTILNDVWYSEDGINWTQATPSNFPARTQASVLIFDGKMWVMGGYDGNNYVNEVWSSEDGVTWTKQTQVNSFPSRRGHTSGVFGDKMWIIGGYDGTYLDDVWTSTDGVDWKKTSIKLIIPMALHISEVYGGDLFFTMTGVGSGATYNDEGIVVYTHGSYSHLNSNLGLPSRLGACSAVFDEKLWVIGGYYGSSALNDVWYMD